MLVSVTVRNPDGQAAVLPLAFDYEGVVNPPHAYFEELVKRADHWKSYSLRSQAFFGSNPWVTYDAEMDAAKVVIPAFKTTCRLLAPLDAASRVIAPSDTRNALWPVGRIIQIGDEILTVVSKSAGLVTVNRAQYGTSAGAYPVNEPVLHATNSLPQQARFDLRTQDGFSYFFEWEARWSPAFVGLNFNHKAWQFSSGSSSGDAIWLEPHIAYSIGSVASRLFSWLKRSVLRVFGIRAAPSKIGTVILRSYNKSGGPAEWAQSDGNQLGPGGLTFVNSFPLMHSTWVRFFVLIQQRANDYDRVSYWAADETRDPVLLVDGALISVRPGGATPHSIQKWWIEFNSSYDDHFRTDMRDLVVHVRNFAALRWPIGTPTDLKPLLVRPMAA